MSDRSSTCSEMNTEGVDALTVAENVISTDIHWGTSALAIGVKRRIVDPEDGYAVRHPTKSTQTPGHLFIGKRGELVITTNYTLVKLVLDKDVVQRLIEPTSEVDRIADIIMTHLARLEWNGERILQNAMTSFRLTLQNDLMPQLLKEVAELLSSEHEHHRVEQLAHDLLERHLTKLFGVDVGSLIFILEHCSVDDATLTLTSTQKQEELQGVLLSFLPKWVRPLAVWTVTAYQLTADDRVQNFGFQDITEVSFGTLPGHAEESSSEAAPGLESPMLSKDEDVEPSDTSQSASRSVGAEGSSHGPSFAGLTEERGERRVTFMEEPKVPSQVEEDLQKRPGSIEGIAGDTGSEKATAEPEMLTLVSGWYQPGSKIVLRLEDVDTDDIPKLEVDLRIVIMGTTGSGKSSTGNSILGQDLFPVDNSFSAVTTECRLGTASRDGTIIEVLDTPGFFDLTLTTQEVSNMVLRAVSRMEDGPDVVLYTIRIGGRYTEQEFDTYNLLKALLDDNITNYIHVVFTWGDLLSGQEIRDMLMKPQRMATMIQECGHRYTVFDNTADDKTAQVNQLLTNIQQMKLQNRGRRYRCPRFAENLDDIDLELELRLVKAEQQRLKRKTYVQTLEARLRQTQDQLRKQREEFARKEQASLEASKRREEAVRERIVRMTEALQREYLEEEERRKQIEALREQVAEEERQSLTHVERVQRRQMKEWKKQTEETQERLEKLQAERDQAEKEAAQRQAEEMTRLRMEIATSKRRRKNGCSMM